MMILMRKFIRFGVEVAVIFVIALFINNYLISLSHVNGESMEPNFQHGDWVMLYQWDDTVNRDDVFVVDPQLSSHKKLIKRIVGLPGDRVQLIGDDVWINGEKYNAPYRVMSLMSSGMTPDERIYDVPDGFYFILGDNRPNSLDSRDGSVGFVSKSQLIGKVGMKLGNIPFFLPGIF